MVIHNRRIAGPMVVATCLSTHSLLTAIDVHPPCNWCGGVNPHLKAEVEASCCLFFCEYTRFAQHSQSVKKGPEGKRCLPCTFLRIDLGHTFPEKLRVSCTLRTFQINPRRRQVQGENSRLLTGKSQVCF